MRDSLVLIHWVSPLLQACDPAGLMPPAGSEVVNFKIAELCGKRGRKPHVKASGAFSFLYSKQAPSLLQCY